MGAVWKIMGKDFKRRLKDPFSLLGLLAFPIILAVIIGLAFSSMGDGTLPATELLITDHDQGAVSAVMKAALRQGRADMPRLALREVNEAEGRKTLERGQASALLIFPADFTQDYFAGQQTRLTLLKNPTQAFLPEVAEQYADVLALVSSYVSQLFSQEMDTLRDMVTRKAMAPKLEWLLLGDGLYNKLKAVERYLYPAPIRIQVGQAGRTGNASLASAATRAQRRRAVRPAQPSHFVVMEYILPGLAIFSICFVAQVVLLDIYAERSQHTMARLLTTPVTVTAFLTGKILGGCVISLVSLILLQGVGRLAFGVNWGPIGLVLLVNVIAVLGILGLCLVVFCMARTQAQASAVLSVVILSMALFSGSFVPLFMLPSVFQRISQFTLNGHLVKAYHSLMYRQSLASVAWGLGGVALLGVGCCVIGVLFLRRRMGRGV